jgi:hypothetical protein
MISFEVPELVLTAWCALPERLWTKITSIAGLVGGNDARGADKARTQSPWPAAAAIAADIFLTRWRDTFTRPLDCKNETCTRLIAF